MKRILFILLVAYGSVAQAQLTGGTLLPTGKYQGFNKSAIATGKRVLDGKYSYYDTINFVSRPFTSTTEANAFLPVNNRGYGQTVLINTGGTINTGGSTTVSGITYATGEIIGGTNDEYWYRNNTANAGLIIKGSAADLSNYVTNSKLNDSLATRQKKLTAGENIFYDESTGTISAAGGASLPSVSSQLSGTGAPGSPLAITNATDYNILSSIKVRAFGDSMTYGTGGTTTDSDPGGTPYMEHLKAATGFTFSNYGVPGQTSDSIRNRLIRDSANRQLPTIIWAGTNNLGFNANILSDIATMVNSLGHTRYLIIDLLGQNTSTYYTGQGANTAIHQLNDALETAYPGHVVHIRQPLINAYNPALSGDVTAHANDVWPPSYGTDETHLNDAGLRFVASQVLLKIDTLKSRKVEGRVLTTSEIQRLFSYPANIGRGQAAAAAFTDISINGAANEGPYLTDVTGTVRRTPLNVAGAARFSFRGTTSQRQQGLDIKESVQDIGGYSAMEIAGMNPLVWTSPGQGMRVRNDARSFDFGSPISVAGDINNTGTIYTGQVITTGALRGAAINNIPDGNNFKRSVHFTSPATGNLRGGIILPNIGSAQIQGIYGLELGEMWYNAETNRYEGVVPHPTISQGRQVEPFAFVSDLFKPHVSAQNGAGTTFSGDGTPNNPFSVNIASFPAVAKLTGTPFSIDPGAFYDPNRVAAKAFDGDLGTAYISAPSDYQTGNYVGLDLGIPHIVTQVRFQVSAGYDIAGAKIQGSNTSSSAGFVDLFTVPSNADKFYFNQYAVSTNTEYRYYRLLQAPGSYLLGVVELEFYGYATPAPLILTTSGTSGPATITGKTINIPQYSGGAGGSDSSYVRSANLPDSTGFVLYRKNGDSTVFNIYGVGGVSGGGPGSVTSLSVGNLSNLATANVATATSTPSVTFSMIQPTAHTFFGNNTGSTTSPGYVSLDTTDIANFRLKVRAIVKDQITDSLSANSRTFRNAQRASYDSITKTTGSTTIFKNFGLQVVGSGISYTSNSTDSTFGGQLTITPPDQSVYATKSNVGYTITESNGRYQKILFYGSTSGQTYTLPSAAPNYGMTITIRNASSVTLNISTVYSDPTTTVTTIAPGSWIEVSPNTDGKWYIYEEH